MIDEADSKQRLFTRLADSRTGRHVANRAEVTPSGLLLLAKGSILKQVPLYQYQGSKKSNSVILLVFATLNTAMLLAVFRILGHMPNQPGLSWMFSHLFDITPLQSGFIELQNRDGRSGYFYFLSLVAYLPLVAMQCLALFANHYRLSRSRAPREEIDAYTLSAVSGIKVYLIIFLLILSPIWTPQIVPNFRGMTILSMPLTGVFIAIMISWLTLGLAVLLFVAIRVIFARAIA